MNSNFRDMIDAMLEDDSDAGDDFRASVTAGCNADDTTDSRGEKLRPLRNDAGEPWWM